MLETKKYWIFSIFAIALIALLPSLSSTGQVGGAYIESNPLLPIAPDSIVLIPERSEHAESLDLTARSVLVKDINSDLLLFEKNIDSVLPIASLTKLLTGLLVQNKTDLSGEVEIQFSDTEVVPFTADLVAGEVLSVKDLVNVMLVASANDAAMALARGISGSVEQFVSEMNDLAQDLGMTSSLFTNPVGFDNPNHYSTASDMTLLIDEFLRVPELRDIVSQQEYALPESQKGKARIFSNTNELLGYDERIKGVKTGYTTNSRGSLIIFIEDELHPYYLVVIGSQNREEEARELIQWVEKSYSWK